MATVAPYEQVLAILYSNGVVFVALMAAFHALRRILPRSLQPRVYDEWLKGLPPLPKSYWNVLCPVARVRRRVVLQVAGLDGYMYLRTLQLCLVSCLCLCAFGLAVVLPVNLTGSVASDALVQASIGNVTRDTLWLHVPIVYCVFIWAMVLIHRLYKEYTHLRHRYLSQQRAAQLTVFVETIPAELASDDTQLAALFEQYFPGSVHSAHMVRLSHALDVLLDERDAAIVRFQEADCRHVATGVRPTKRTSCCGGRVDVIEACEAELVRLHADIVKEREELGHSRAGSCGFVTFNNHRAAALAIMGRIVDDPVNVATSRAPEARDLIWQHLSAGPRMRSLRTSIGYALGIAVSVAYVIPVFWVQFLAQWEHAVGWGDWIPGVDALPASTRAWLFGSLPPYGLALLLDTAPLVFRAITKSQKLISRSAEVVSHVHLYFYFLLFHQLAVSVLSAALLRGGGAGFKSLEDLPGLIGDAVPDSSLFFAKYILVRTLTTAPLQLLRVVTLAKQYLHSRILKSSPHKLQSLYGPSTRDLGKSVPIVVVNYILALVYAPISPAIVLPACSLYFGVSFVLAKYKLLYVYEPKFETGGRFWALAANRMVVGFMLAELLLAFVMIHKEAYAQAVCLAPLLVITALFTSHVLHKLEPLAENLPRSVACDADTRVRFGWRAKDDDVKRARRLSLDVIVGDDYVPACLHESVQFDELVEDIRAEQSPPLQPRVPAYVAAKTKLVALTRLMAGKHDPDLHSHQPPTTPKRDRGDAKAADEAPVTTPAGKVVPAHARMLTGVTVEVDTGEGVRSSVQADHGGTLYRRMLDKSTDTEEDAMQVQLRGDTLVFEARITGRELHDDHVEYRIASRFSDDPAQVSVCLRRYREFLKLLDDISHESIDLASLPKLPPKKWLRNMEPEFLEKRQHNLQLFLNGLIANAVTRADSTFVQFLRSPPEDESKAASV